MAQSGSDRYQPVAVIALPSYEDLLADIGFVGKLLDRPELADQAQAILTLTAGGLRGLDKSRPIGIVALSDGENMKPLGFVPVTDLERLIAGFAPLTGGRPLEPDDEGIYEIPAGLQKVYLRGEGEWAFVTRTREALEDTPEAPLKMLSALPTRYDIAFRLFVQNIPEDKRQQAIAQMKAGLEAGLERREGEDEESYQARKKVAESTMKQLVELVEQTENVTLGWKLDADASLTYLDVSVTAVPGSDFAKETAYLADSESKHAGFLLPSEAITAHFNFGLHDDEQIEQYSAAIDAIKIEGLKKIDEEADLPSDEARATVKEAFGELLEVLRATIRQGRIDGGAVVSLSPESITFAAGGTVADGAKVEEVIKKLAEVAEKDPNFQGVKWDIAQHAGVRFHSLEVPIPDDEARELLGDPLTVIFGVAPEEFYVAFGKDSLDTLKAVLDRSKALSDEKLPPMQVVLSLSKLARFAAHQKDGDEEAQEIADSLEKVAGKDHVRLSVKAIERGFIYRLEADGGVLKAIGKAAAGKGQLGGGGGGVF